MRLGALGLRYDQSRTWELQAMPKLMEIVVDLGGRLQIIDDSVEPPRWKTVASLNCASRANAERSMRQLGLTSAWLRDDCGERRLITL